MFLALLLSCTVSCKNYNSILEKVYEDDQASRQWTHNMSSLSAEEIIRFNKEMQSSDSMYQNIVFRMLDKVGWPGGLSEKANKAIWIVIDHSDIKNQQKYLPLVISQSGKGVISKADCAVLQDRILMGIGKPQIYGTQIKMSATIIGNERSFVYNLWPVENAGRIDSIRNSVGLNPVEEYLADEKEHIGADIVWDRNKTVSDFLSE